MHAITQKILMRAAERALQQNVSGNLAAHVSVLVDDGVVFLGMTSRQVGVVKHELRVLGLLGTSNGGYLS